MQLSVTHVIVVKGRLTFDGVTPLLDEGDGPARAPTVAYCDATIKGALARRARLRLT